MGATPDLVRPAGNQWGCSGDPGHREGCSTTSGVLELVLTSPESHCALLCPAPCSGTSP